jgi:hypothetical protein
MIRDGPYLSRGAAKTVHEALRIMNDRRVVELIEDAMRTSPFCACGSWTVVVAEGDRVRLECSTLQKQPGILRRLVSLDFGGHTRRTIVDGLPTDEAA